MDRASAPVIGDVFAPSARGAAAGTGPVGDDGGVTDSVPSSESSPAGSSTADALATGGPAGGVPAAGVPAANAVATGGPAGGVPAANAVATGGPAGDASAGDALAGDALAGDALAGDALAGGVPVQRSRVGRDMLLSLAVLVIPVLILVAVYETVFSGAAPIAVDPSDTWATARHSATFQVLQPQGLPPKWTVTSATFASGTVRVGYVTPSGTGLQLVETASPADTFLPAELGADARPGNLVPIGEREWRAYPSVGSGNRALVLVDDGRTVLVIGSARDEDLRTFAGTLR